MSNLTSIVNQQPTTYIVLIDGQPITTIEIQERKHKSLSWEIYKVIRAEGLLNSQENGWDVVKGSGINYMRIRVTGDYYKILHIVEAYRVDSSVEVTN